MENDLAGISEKHPVVLFDGVCNLCNTAVQWIIRNDPNHRFRFLPLQSPRAQKFLSNADEKTRENDGLDSVILIENGKIYTMSSAALRIASRLRFPWPLLGLFRVLPASIRDFFYRFVARHRYRLFGKKEKCMIPGPEFRKLFLSEA